jgi:hypothetical protein
VSRKERIRLNLYITIDSVNDILGREWRNLGINVDQQVGKRLDEIFPFFLGNAIDRL